MNALSSKCSILLSAAMPTCARSSCSTHFVAVRVLKELDRSVPDEGNLVIIILIDDREQAWSYRAQRRKSAKFSKTARAFGEQYYESDDLCDVGFETEKISVSRVGRKRLGIFSQDDSITGSIEPDQAPKCVSEACYRLGHITIYDPAT